MTPFRIALANLPIASHPDEAVELAEQAIARAGEADAGVICFPECYVPGYRCCDRVVAPPDPAFLERAWARLAAAAREAKVTAIVGTERPTPEGLRIAALVIEPQGSIAGWQDKVQLDPSEDGIYTPGSKRQLFQAGALTFGIAICHEGFRYPETVRWAVRRGAQVVFHPHLQEADPQAGAPTSYAEPNNSFHEKAALCRAAENTCYYATVNCASEGSATTSAVIRPDGTLQCYQPYGEAGLLVADLDLELATGRLARRFKPQGG